MIFDAFGNKVNDDGTPINQPLSGSLPDLSNETVSPTMVSGGSSKNYQTGVAGWRMTNDGDLEANSGTFRGSITGASGTFGNMTLNVTEDTIIVNDGTNDRVLIGKLVGKF